MQNVAGSTAEEVHPYTDWYIKRSNQGEGEGESVPLLQ
jgi:hypothetical protein